MGLKVKPLKREFWKWEAHVPREGPARRSEAELVHSCYWDTHTQGPLYPAHVLYGSHGPPCDDGAFEEHNADTSRAQLKLAAGGVWCDCAMTVLVEALVLMAGVVRVEVLHLRCPSSSGDSSA